MDKAQLISTGVTTFVAVAAIVGAFIGSRAQARAAVESVRRGHQRSAYADLVRTARAYLNENRHAVLAAAKLDANCQPGVDPEDDDCLDTAAIARLRARITPERADTGRLLEAATLVLLEGPIGLSTQADSVARAAGELRDTLREAGTAAENVDGSTEWPDRGRAENARKLLEDELATFITLATKVINEKSPLGQYKAPTMVGARRPGDPLLRDLADALAERVDGPAVRKLGCSPQVSLPGPARTQASPSPSPATALAEAWPPSPLRRDRKARPSARAYGPRPAGPSNDHPHRPTSVRFEFVGLLWEGEA
ncbi:hypothetical protein ACFCZ6_38010 [Streptomyces hydrogenans]|uniref:hypothetical protein n=1 Tax=Streptomyces hydrogenans TaxID=1873719 RepID=UPI0035DF40E8